MGVSFLVFGDVDAAEAAAAEAGEALKARKDTVEPALQSALLAGVFEGGVHGRETAGGVLDGLAVGEEIGVSVLKRGETFPGSLVYPVITDDTESGGQGLHVGAQLDRAAQHRVEGGVLGPDPVGGAGDGRGKELRPPGGPGEVVRALILAAGDGAGLGTVEAGKAPVDDGHLLDQELLDGVGGGEGVGEGGEELIEGLVGFVGFQGVGDDGLGEDAVGEGVVADGGFAFGRAGAGGALGVGPVGG